MLNHDTLSNFTGSQTFTPYGMAGGYMLTEGARHVADNGGAFWLMDMIASYYFVARVRNENFQVHTLTKNKRGSGAKMTVTDGNGNKLFTQRIAYTDFPFPESGKFVLWCVNRVIMLPSEY